MTRHCADIKKFIPLTDKSFIIHFGKNYEAKVLQANHNSIPVIGIINVSGRPSAIPLERANYLLEKYYAMVQKDVYHAPPSEMHQPTITQPTMSAVRDEVISGAA